MTGPDPLTLAGVVLASGPMLTRYLAGFDDATRVARAPGLPNHVAWTLGHCAYTMGRLVERFGGPSLPARDFAERGDASTFTIGSVRLGTTPDPEPEAWPTLDRCRRAFEDGVERLAASVGGATRADLARRVDWGGTDRPLGELVSRVSLHNAIHAGQLADLRRALGMARVSG